MIHLSKIEFNIRLPSKPNTLK